jgi:hypothetical protein
MKKVIVLALLYAGVAAAQTGSTETVLNQVYGAFGTACTQDADADTGEHNRLGPFTSGKRYVVYCHDGAGLGVACECLQGTSSVDASAAVGFTLFLGEKMIVKIPSAKRYISCVPFVNNQKIDVCPLE